MGWNESLEERDEGSGLTRTSNEKRDSFVCIEEAWIQFPLKTEEEAKKKQWKILRNMKLSSVWNKLKCETFVKFKLSLNFFFKCQFFKLSGKTFFNFHSSAKSFVSSLKNPFRYLMANSLSPFSSPYWSEVH